MDQIDYFNQLVDERKKECLIPIQKVFVYGREIMKRDKNKIFLQKLETRYEEGIRDIEEFVHSLKARFADKVADVTFRDSASSRKFIDTVFQNGAYPIIETYCVEEKAIIETIVIKYEQTLQN